MAKRTYVAVILDGSGSMSSIKSPAVLATNSMLDTIKNRSEAEREETFLAFITFNNYVNTLIQPTPISNVGRVDPKLFHPQGGTALFDAVGQAVELLQKQPGANHKDTSFLVMAITDGEENTSIKYKARNLNLLMKDTQDTGRWTFAFQVPRGYAQTLISRFGIPSDNVREWEATSAGVAEMAVQSNLGLTNFYQERAKGATATRSFYTPVTPDLSKASLAQVKRSLDDVTSEYKLYEVQKEQNIKDFVESKTKYPYQVGTAFYQLMKTEKVQPQKGVLLLEKTNEKVFGGAGARDIVGLPDASSGQHARVYPGNHSNYDIFVQSTSQNRILPRGTKVLVRK
jgi:uncharacterized protein YegL